MSTEKFPVVTVIIPMYNAEKYIEECLQSLLNQTLQNFEVIVVDDCSTDNSLAITENMIPAFATRNLELLTVTLTQNSGCPGIPRNTAIDFAKGKYIYFLDSDDFLDSTALEDFYKVAEEFNADVIHSEKCFTYSEIDGKFVDNLFSTEVGEFVENPTLETSDIAKRVTDFIERRYLWCCCNKLFRREFLIENNIKFPETNISEDMIFAFMCVVCAQNYVRVPLVNYHYRIHEAALSQISSATVNLSLNLIEGVYFLDNFLQGKNFFTENQKYRYAVIDFFNQIFLDIISENLLVTEQLEPAEIYAFYCNEIFSINPQKNIPLTAYLFVSANIYKLFVKQQTAEIAALRNLLENK